MTDSQTTPFKKLLMNSLFSVGSWGFLAVISLIITPYLIKKLTIEGYGIYSLLIGMIGYCGLFDLGLGEGVTKFVAEYKTHNQTQKLLRSIHAALFIQVVGGLIGAGLILFFSHSIVVALRISESFIPMAVVCMNIMAVSFFVTMLSGTFTATLKGLQDYDKLSVINFGINMLLYAGIVIVLYRGGGLIEVITVTALSAVFLFVAFVALVKKRLPEYRFEMCFSTQEVKTILRFSGFLFLARLSALFNTYIVRFVISFFLGPAAVTFYFIPFLISQVLGNFLSTTFHVFFPYASELKAQENMALIRTTMVESSKLLAALSIPIFLTVAVFSQPILYLWMGNEFASKGWIILTILSVSSIIGSLTTIPNLFAMGMGYSKIIGIFSIFTLVAYSILLPTLTKQWGINGAAWAILFSQLPGVILIFFQIKKIFKMSIAEYFRRTLSFHLFPSLVAIGLFVFLQGHGYDSRYICFWGGMLLAGYFVAMVVLKWMPLVAILAYIKRR